VRSFDLLETRERGFGGPGVECDRVAHGRAVDLLDARDDETDITGR
jgi:hypothetical protein